MTIASRTPEGFPSNCPLCGAATNLEFSDPAGDAPCPRCGHLVWFSAQCLASFRDRIAAVSNNTAEGVTADTRLTDLDNVDSLDLVELVMELEEEFEGAIPDNLAGNADTTIGDLIRHIEQFHKFRGR